MSSLVSNLTVYKYHPVLIFGLASSGKTLLLLSLFDYLRKQASTALNPGAAPLIPSDYPGALARNEDGVTFFTRDLINYRNGVLPYKTQKDHPFLIPTVLSPPEAKSEPVQLAFLEGMGEWYKLDHGSKTPYPEFKEAVDEILMGYTEGGVTAIFVAPAHSTLPQYKRPDPSENIDTSLAAAILQYNNKRGFQQKDNQMLLVSKWDTLYTTAALGTSMAGDLEANVRDHIFYKSKQRYYPETWNNFSHLLQKPKYGSRVFMPHASCRVENNKILKIPDLVPFFDHFNRTLANWLYGNATADLLGERRILFPDVVPSTTSWSALYGNFLYLSAGKWLPF